MSECVKLEHPAAVGRLAPVLTSVAPVHTSHSLNPNPKLSASELDEDLNQVRCARVPTSIHIKCLHVYT